MTPLKWGTLVGVVVLLVGLAASVVLVQQPQLIGKRAAGGGTDGQLTCDAGTNPYNSSSITVNNTSTQTIERMIKTVYRCRYVPGKIEANIGSFTCDNYCDEQTNTHCLRGEWIQGEFESFALTPGQTKTINVTANACEIVQFDVFNDAVNGIECWNLRSTNTNPPPPAYWPGGISFAISQNSLGYNASTQSCPTPTNTPTNTPTPTAPPTAPSATPTPTVAPGQPTNTPTPTSIRPTSTPRPTTPFIPTNTPIPTQPVSGTVEITTIGIIGGVSLLLLTLFLAL